MGKVLLDEENTVKLDDTSVGFYLDGEGTIQYGTLHIENLVGDKQVIGVYYAGDITHDTERTYRSLIKVTDQKHVIANYLKAAHIRNEGTVEITNGEENIAAYVTEGSHVTNAGTITLTGVKDGVGFYVKKSQVDNAKEIKVDGTSVAMIGVDQSTLTNSGSITSERIGMYLKDSKGINTGTIVSDVGIHLVGNNASFENRGGEVKVGRLGLYLEDVTAGTVSANKITLSQNNAIAVYAKNSKVNFDIAPGTEGDLSGIISLYATGTTAISSHITTAPAKDAIGVYVQDSSATFDDGAKVTAKAGREGHYNTGIYLREGYDGTIAPTIENEAYSMGLRVAKGAKVVFGGALTTAGKDSIGALVEGELTITDKTVFTVGEGGIGLYANHGIVHLEKGTFHVNKGTAIHQQGGSITLGADVTIDGVGTILSAQNSDISLKNSFTVGEKGIGVIATYDDSKTHSITSTGDIRLQSAAVGLASVAQLGDRVTITQSGSIESTEGSEKTIGVYGKNVNVENTGKIATHTGIYVTGTATVTSEEIEGKGEKGIGLFGNGVEGDSTWKVGKVTGSENSQVGVYLHESRGKISLTEATIRLTGKSSKGLVVKNGQDFKLQKSTISVGENGVGIAGFATGGVVSDTTLTLGKEAVGVYLEGEKTLRYGGEISGTIGSTLAFAKDKGTILLDITQGKNLVVSENGGGVAARNGTVTTDKKTIIEVNGGIGAYLRGESSDTKANISQNFHIHVNEKGIGVYAVGHVGEMPVHVELKGNQAKGYVLHNLASLFTRDRIEVGKYPATEQIGIYSFGTGNGLAVDSLSVSGNKNYGIYNIVDQTIDTTTITVGNSDKEKSSIGVYSKAGIINAKGVISSGSYSAGIYTTGVTVNQTFADAALSIGEKGIGIYATKRSTVTLAATGMTLGEGGMGVKSEDSSVTLANDIEIKGNKKWATGIFSQGQGMVTVKGNLIVQENLLGVYSENQGKVVTADGKTITVEKDGTGILAYHSEVDNHSSVMAGENAKGIFVEKGTLSSVGSVITEGKAARGLISVDGTFTSKGDITVGGEASVGLYGRNSDVTSTGNLSVKDKNGIGIFSNQNITHKGNMAVGKEAVGLFKKSAGTVNLTADTVHVDERGYAVYYEGEDKGNSTFIATVNSMVLGREAVGLYANHVHVSYHGDITVGETTVGENGFNDYRQNKNSVGMYVQNSNVEYTGHLVVDKPMSVGIYAKKDGNITIKSGSVIDVKNGAFGIMSDDDNGNGVITIEKGATFHVSGRALDVNPNANKVNVSIGIGGYGGVINNYGHFHVSDKAWGIYYDEDTTFNNYGTFEVTNGGRKWTGIEKEAGVAGGKFGINLAGDVIHPNEPTRRNFENFGVIKAEGKVNLDYIVLNLTDHMHIEASEYEGTALVNPTFSEGNSVEEYVYKDVFRPKEQKGLGKFMGDVKSKSISWMAKVGKINHKNPSETKDIIMTRIPYTALMKGPHHDVLADGLEKVRLGIPKNQSSEIFKSLDKINNYAGLANSIANVRGDVYANIQERILDVDADYDRAYEELISSPNRTKKVHKWSVMTSHGRHDEDTIGVSPYMRNSLGLLYLNEKEDEAMNRKYGFSVGFLYSHFSFSGATAKNSTEKVYSPKIGAHFQRQIGKLTFNTRGTIGFDWHRMHRYSYVDKDIYDYDGHYHTMDVGIKTKLSYAMRATKDIMVTPYIKMDMSYNRILHMTEEARRDPALRLYMAQQSYLLVTPRVGLDMTYETRMKDDKVLTLRGAVEYRYDAEPLYRKGNAVRFENKNVKKFYDLAIPGRKTHAIRVMGEIGLRGKDQWGFLVRGEYEEAMNWSLRMNYRY